MDIFATSRIAEGLAARGIAVLRFDFTGIGGSEGDLANTNFSSNVGDLLAAAAWLRQHHGSPSFLIGHSLDGAAVLAAAPDVPDAAAVVTTGALACARMLAIISPPIWRTSSRKVPRKSLWRIAPSPSPGSSWTI
jgi:alpha-beta hydrolase superfamily lysophospholipase